MAIAQKLRSSQAAARGNAAAPVVRSSRMATVVRASAQQQQSSEAPAAQLSRREVFLSVAGSMASVALASALPAHADDEYSLFLGYATPPTSYGGYGGNAKEAPKYSFEYPASWKPDQPNKVEKGTQGIDGRVTNPRSKDQRAFLITLTRAGEDNARFRLTDLESTLNSFASADYDLQDALSASTNRTSGSRDVDGNTFYDYDIESPEFRYLVTITVSQGKVFALFVRSPTKSFAANEAKLRHVVDTFKLL